MTDDTLMCGLKYEHAKYFTIYVVTRITKNYKKIFNTGDLLGSRINDCHKLNAELNLKG